MTGTVVGAVILGILTSGFTFLNVDAHYQETIKGGTPLSLYTVRDRISFQECINVLFPSKELVIHLSQDDLSKSIFILVIFTRSRAHKASYFPRRKAELARPPSGTDALTKAFVLAMLPNGKSCAGFWTPASRGAPLAPAAGVQKAPRHEVAGSLGPGGQPALWGFDFRVDYDGGREAGARRPG